MNATILVGHGVNMLEGQSMDWERLLEKLALYVNKQEIMKYIDHKPFTLVYEEIVLKSARRSGKKEIDIKRYVAEIINAIPFNKYHRLFVQSGIRHILTTNYDYNLEESSKVQAEKGNIKRESKYNLYRRRKVGDAYVWHIHGEGDVPNSITLGHEQFAGSIQKMRLYLTSGRRKSGSIPSPFKGGNLYFEEDGSPYSWVDVFLRDDVHIIGFSLDYTEIDIWWLLSYKERLKQSGKYQVGETYYHQIQTKLHQENEKAKKDKVIKDKAKFSILESFGVHVNKFRGSYQDGYDKFLNEISR